MKKSKRKSDPVYVIGFIVIFIFLAIGLIIPNRVEGMSRSAALDFIMAGMVSAVLAIVGVVILFFYGLYKFRMQTRCPSCGAKTQARDDRFCRVCGVSLAK